MCKLESDPTQSALPDFRDIAGRVARPKRFPASQLIGLAAEARRY